MSTSIPTGVGHPGEQPVASSLASDQAAGPLGFAGVVRKNTVEAVGPRTYVYSRAGSLARLCATMMATRCRHRDAPARQNLAQDRPRPMPSVGFPSKSLGYPLRMFSLVKPPRRFALATAVMAAGLGLASATPAAGAQAQLGPLPAYPCYGYWNPGCDDPGPGHGDYGHGDDGHGGYDHGGPGGHGGGGGHDGGGGGGHGGGGH